MRSTPTLSRRAQRVLSASIALLLVGNVAAIFVVGNRVTPVSVESAVARFRELQEASPAPAAALGEAASVGAATSPEGSSIAAVGLTGEPATSATPANPNGAGLPDDNDAPARPASGVYVYATSGYEEVSVAGARHTYPDRTTMTITPAACGMDVRWDVFEERWDRWTLCTPGRRLELRQFETYHEFFGQVEHRTYDCVRGTDFRPESSEPGATTKGRCASGGAVVDLTSTVIAVDEIAVGSVMVPAVHVRVDEVLTGDTRGTRSSDSWYSLTNGLLLRRTAVTKVDTEAVFGSTSYSEELSLALTSLEPRS